MDMNQETKVTVIDDRLRQEEAETLCRWAAARAASSLIISSVSIVFLSGFSPYLREISPLATAFIMAKNSRTR